MLNRNSLRLFILILSYLQSLFQHFINNWHTNCYLNFSSYFLSLLKHLVRSQNAGKLLSVEILIIWVRVNSEKRRVAHHLLSFLAQLGIRLSLELQNFNPFHA